MKKYIIEDEALMKEWNWEKNNALGLYPDKLTCGSSKKAWWKCDKNHKYESLIKDKVRRNQSCPICQNKKVFEGINDFFSKYSNLLSEWDFKKNENINPKLLSQNSHKKAWWKCSKCGYEWQTTIYHRTIRHQSCPVCTNRVVKQGINDLKTLNPILAEEWDYEKNKLKPEEITPGSHKKVWWKCSKCGYEWQAQIKSRNNGCGCAICSRKLRKKPTYVRKKPTYVDYCKSLEYLLPELTKEWDTQKNVIKPDQVGINSKFKVWWKCSKCGYEYERQIRNRAQRNYGCPKCSTKNSTYLNIGINDLKSQNPLLLKEWNYKKNIDIKPENCTVNSGRKVWWICPVGHEYMAGIRERNKGSNCPICNKRCSSSFPEQAIFYYIKKEFPDAINKYKEIFSNTMELDIFIPSINVGIEYDGKYWHNSEESYIRELKKFEICKKNNITLIRIKEKCDNLWKDTADLTYVLDNVNNRKLLEKHIFHILDLLCKFTIKYLYSKKNINSFNSIPKTSIDLERDKSEIYLYLSNIENSVAKLYPDLIKEWDYEKNLNLKPEMFKSGSIEKIWWKCSKCGYKWKANINYRTPPNNSGCPECAKRNQGETFHKNYLKKKGSLLKNNPDLAKEYHPTKNIISIEDITEKSPKNVWWKCIKCGYEWSSSPNNRSKGVGCPCCSGRVPKKGVNDLETLYPKIAQEWDYEKNENLPSDYKPKSGKRVWWKCLKCGYEWQAIIGNRVNEINNCPNCKKK